MTTLEGLTSELFVQRVVWRERLDALRVERDNADKTYGNDREWNQFYGAVATLARVISELDHILEDIEDRACDDCGEPYADRGIHRECG